MEQATGNIKSSYDCRDYQIKEAKYLPCEYEAYIGDVKNQLNQPTCTSHAMATILEAHYYKQHNKKETFSTEFINGRRPENLYQGNGLSLRDAINTCYQCGDLFEQDMAGNNDVHTAISRVMPNLDALMEKSYPHHISGYWRCDDERAIKTSLYYYGSCLASIKWYNNSSLSATGVYQEGKGKYTRHCIAIYGWDDAEGWKCQNSWGKLWGINGRFTIPFDVKLEEVWGIQDDFIEEQELIKTKLPKWLCKVINAIVRFISGIGIRCKG